MNKTLIKFFFNHLHVYKNISHSCELHIANLTIHSFLAALDSFSMQETVYRQIRYTQLR